MKHTIPLFRWKSYREHPVRSTQDILLFLVVCVGSENVFQGGGSQAIFPPPNLKVVGVGEATSQES